jgi:hypothetical protein
MRPSDDSIPLTPDERLAEVASILAAGVLRLHTRMALSPDAAGLSARKSPAKSAAPGLEVPDETVLSVHNG